MKPYLVALDGSPHAAQVLATAERLAAKTEATLHLLRVVALPSGLPSEAYALPPDELAALLRHDALVDLSALAAPLVAARRGRLRVEIGTPWRVVCDVARDLAVEMIVIGSHGSGTLDRLLGGTIAAKIVAHAGCPVLIVKHPSAAI